MAIMTGHFNGLNRDRIAKKVRKGPSTVSREIEKFKNEVNSRGLQRAAEAYGVSQIVNELHTLSVELAENKVTVAEATEGAAVASKLKTLQVDHGEIPLFITNVYNRSTEKGYSPSDIVADCATLRNLESTYNGTFEEIKKKYEEMGSKINGLREEARRLETENVQAEKNNAELWEQYNIDKTGLKQFKDTKDALTRLGLNIEDMDKTKTVLTEIRKLKFNPRQIIKKIVDIKDLEKRKSVLDEEVKHAGEVLGDLKHEIGEADTQIKAKRRILDEAKKLEETRLTITDIQAVRNTVISVAANNGLTPKQALKKLQEDIIENYDKILGLEPEVKSLTCRKEKLETEIKELKEEVNKTKLDTAAQVAALKEEYKTVEEKIDAYLQLRRKGVTDKDLIRWASIITATKLNPTIIDEELKTQKNLKQLEDDANKRINLLESRETELKATVNRLVSKRNKIEKSIEAVQQAGINRIKEAADSTSKQATATLNTMTKTATEISRQTQGILEDSKQKMRETIDKAEKSAETTEKKLEHISEQINTITDDAIKAGEKIGSLHPIAEAYQFLDTGIGEPQVVVPLAINVLSNLKTWLEKHNHPGILLDSKIDEVIGGLKKIG